ncbi:MAG: IS3 family transposase [Candidatus Nanoarchaeia archaeon]
MSIEALCELLGYSKQAYYKKMNSKRRNDYKELLIVELIKDKRKLWKKGSGRNLHKSLESEFEKHRIKVGRDKFYELLRKYDLLIKSNNRRTRTTYSYHHFRKYPNLIENKEAQRPNHILVSDITYIWLTDQECFAYLFLTTDVYSRKILGYCLSNNLKAEAALKTIKRALIGANNTEDSIHHSDRGVQYCCDLYTDYLKSKNIKISMTQNGDPLENPIAERVNKTIKEEFTLQKQLTFSSFSEAKIMIPKIIKFYNQKRPHRSIDMLTPEVAYKSSGKLKRRWKNYYKSNSLNKSLELI